MSLELDPPGLPDAWKVTDSAGEVLIDAASWSDAGRPTAVIRAVEPEKLPTYLLVVWPHESVTVTAEWTVIADDRHALPPGPGVSDLKAHQLFAALARGSSVSEAVRERQQSAEMNDGEQELDPLKRFDDQNTLLRRGRALGAALTRLQARLQDPVPTVEALAARLGSALGPEFLARKVLEEVAEETQSLSEGVFTVAEIALAIGYVDWDHALRYVESDVALARVGAVLDGLEQQLSGVADAPPAMLAYAARALEEARLCVQS
jgi:hypothetical protein